MTNLIEIIKKAVQLVFRTSEAPSDNSHIEDGISIGTPGQEFNLKQLLGGSVPNVIQIYSTQTFTLKYSHGDKSVDQTWPRTLAANQWHSWPREGYSRIFITPSVAATVDIYAAVNDASNSILREGVN